VLSSNTDSYLCIGTAWGLAWGEDAADQSALVSVKVGNS